jgi:UDP-N-acetylmuramoyl-tripeptide--D-alanyl-D-alanine ligase
LFVALKGPSFDGHEFVSGALLQGAVGALVEREVPVAISQVIVPEPLAAMSAFARDWRRRQSIPVVGITGSNGKTTTKELIGSILSQLGPCLVTRGNLNNHIGVPLTLMRLETNHRTAVIEMGANHQGEIRHLASLAEPTIGIVTNAGAAHLEGFGSLEGVARGKGEIFAALPANGVAIVNADDTYVDYWREIAASERLWTFGLNAPADFAAHDIRMTSDASGFRSEFKLTTPAGERQALLRLAGLHNVRNAIGAAAAAFAAGATLDQLVSGLANAAPVGGRLELKAAINGAFLVDDSYNANPSSLKAGLDALSGLPGKHWLVLGDMLELGPTSSDLHAEVGRYARSTGVERLLAVGSHAHFAVEAFGSNAHWYADLDALIAEARQLLSSGVTVLIKGSRGNRLERVSAALALDPKASQPHH